MVHGMHDLCSTHIKDTNRHRLNRQKNQKNPLNMEVWNVSKKIENNGQMDRNGFLRQPCCGFCVFRCPCSPELVTKQSLSGFLWFVTSEFLIFIKRGVDMGESGGENFRERIFTTTGRILFYNSWKEKFADALFRISSMTNSFQYAPWVVCTVPTVSYHTLSSSKTF